MESFDWLIGKQAGKALSTESRKALRENGIALTPDEEQRILELRAEAARQAGRIEFGAGTVDLVIGAFSCSSALDASNAVETLCGAFERFYALRAAVSVEVGDAEIADCLLQAFEDSEGAFELVDLGTLPERLEPQEAGYSISDEQGKTYCWYPAEWECSEFADGWDGEQWGSDFDE